MKTKTFKKNKTEFKLPYNSKPIIEICNVVFNAIDKNWFSRLSITNLTVSIKSLHTGAVIKQPINIGSFVGPNDNKPTLTINRIFKFQFEDMIVDTNPQGDWEVVFNLDNLNLSEDETFEVNYIDKDYVLKRVDNWNERMVSVMGTIQTWLEPYTDYQVLSANPQRMHEGLMKTFDIPMREVPSFQILYKRKVLCHLRHFGLWIIGANGRIDMLTANGNYLLVDRAEPFQNPNWKIYKYKDNADGKEFSFENFKSIIGI